MKEYSEVFIEQYIEENHAIYINRERKISPFNIKNKNSITVNPNSDKYIDLYGKYFAYEHPKDLNGKYLDWKVNKFLEYKNLGTIFNVVTLGDQPSIMKYKLVRKKCIHKKSK